VEAQTDGGKQDKAGKENKAVAKLCLSATNTGKERRGLKTPLGATKSQNDQQLWNHILKAHI